MTEALQDTMRCSLCGEQFEATETVVVGNQRCCRPCSVSIRSDLSLLDRFVAWHDQPDVSELRVTRKPIATEFSPGIWVAIVEFELPDLAGSISMRADGQCDVDYLRLSTEVGTFSYAILGTVDEVTDHLTQTYQTIKRENKSCEATGDNVPS